MNRPTGVTVIAVLWFIGACGLALLACLFLVGGGMAARFMPPDAHIPAGVAAAAGGIVASVVLIFAALYVAIGVGLLQLKEWARIIALVFSALGVLGGVLSLFRFSVFGILRLAICGAIIWYLMQPHVVAAFKGTSAPLMTPPPVPPAR